MTGSVRPYCATCRREVERVLQTESAAGVEVVMRCHGETESLSMSRCDFETVLRTLQLARPLVLAFVPSVGD